MKVGVNDEVETFLVELEMISIHCHEMELAGLVQRLQPDPVFSVQRGLLQ